MELDSQFRLGLPPEEAYQLLLDLDRVTPCMPGAELLHAGRNGARAMRLTVALGPMRFLYEGEVRIAERHDADRRAVLEGSAREARGQGSAKAKITMAVREDGASSLVTSNAQVQLTGRAAQAARGGIVDDVAKQLITQMAQCLETRHGTAAESEPVSARQAGEQAERKPLRLLSVVAVVLRGQAARLVGRLRRRARSS